MNLIKIALVASVSFTLSACSVLSLSTTAPKVVSNEVDESGQRVVETNFTELTTVLEIYRNLNAAVAYKQEGDSYFLLLSNSLMRNTSYAIEKYSLFQVYLKDGTSVQFNALDDYDPCFRCMADEHMGHLDVYGTVAAYEISRSTIEKIKDIGPVAIQLETTSGSTQQDLSEGAIERWILASELFLQQ